MSRKPKRAKPTDPAQHAAEVAARKREVHELQARGVQVVTDEQHRIVTARRLDVFSLLHERKAMTDPQFYAVRRLEALQALAFGHEKPEQTMDRVDGSTVGAPGQNVTQAMIDAMGDYRVIMATTGGQSSKLLMALLSDQAGLVTRWRNTVRLVTAEENDKAQAALVRSACENLAEAWRAFDYRARERREKAA